MNDSSAPDQTAAGPPRRVLIVTPRFPPVNAPDYNRVRVALPFFEECGYEPVILTVHPECIDREIDASLLESVPANIRIEHVRIPTQDHSRYLGVRGIAWRCIVPLYRKGSELLRNEKFDIVFFSTTVFITFALGRVWKKKFGCRVFLDYQDPWQNDFYKRKGVRPPGGNFRYGFATLVSKILEPFSLRAADGVIAVSPDYCTDLQKRYPYLESRQLLTLPFGVASYDFELLEKLDIKNPVFDKNDGLVHWCYVGRIGADMRFLLRNLFAAIRETRLKDPEFWRTKRLYFIGTMYAAHRNNESEIHKLAVEYDISDLVIEQQERISHFENLRVLKDSDLFFLFGSEDQSYFPSKIFQTLFAYRPLFPLFHRDGPAFDLFQKLKLPTLIGFQPDQDDDTLKEEIGRMILRIDSTNLSFPDLREELVQYSAETMTKKLCAFFDRCSSSG